MAHYRAQPRRRFRFPWVGTIVVVVVVGGGLGLWYWAAGGDAEQGAAEPGTAGPVGLPAGGELMARASLAGESGAENEDGTVDSPRAPADQPPDEVLEPRSAAAPALAGEVSPVKPPASEPVPVEQGEAAEPVTPDENAAIVAARRRYEAGQVIEARGALNGLLQKQLSSTAQAEVRRLLARIADETVFSRKRVADDQLVDTHTIRAGEVLINIGKRYHVPAGIIMRINGIKDARRIHAQQEIKVPRGPFHLKIYKSQFRMDVYIQDVYVRSFRVGLGANASTPEGVWRVKNRLANPTFYPPPSAEDKRIIAADDPDNPLGEHWIGLEYVAGDAVNTEKYGIHGTIDPESIGKNASLGCVRMLNPDVAFVYDLVQPGQSTVTIVP